MGGFFFEFERVSRPSRFRAGEDFGPSDCRAVVRPNAPKLAIDATAGCVGCEVSDGLCLVSLPGAASLWVADVSQTPQLRPLASAAPCRVVCCSPDSQRVFLGGGCDDGADSVSFSNRFRTSSSRRWRQCDAPSP